MARSFGARWAVLFLLMTARVASAQDAPADPAEARARVHFQSGSSYFSEGDYESALREFQRGYELSHRPDFFFNFALVYERLGDLDNAVQYLRRYLEETPEERVQSRPTLEERLANFERRLAEQRDEEARRRAEAARLRELEAREGDRAEDEGAGVAAPVIVASAAGAAGLVGFGVLGGLTLSADGDLSEACITRRTCDRDQVDRVQTFALLADISLLVGVAGVATAVVLLWVGSDGEPDEGSVGVAPFVTPEAAGALVRGTL